MQTRADRQVARVLRWSMALVLVVMLAVGATAAAAHRAIDPADPPSRMAFDDASIARGARLAAVGNCGSCHTVDGAPSFAGGVPLKTPFGTIHGTNLTPDPQAGIGRWTEEAFVRAMREGVSRDGHLLYPAFPYTHFTHATDADLHALYAFLMTRDPVDAVPPRNDLVFPLQWRPLIAAWNLLYFEPGDGGDPLRSAARTDRGAYLVASLAHCGACHTTRNALGAEEADRRLAGNVIDGWYAPPLDAGSPSPVSWTADAMTTYLKTGLVADHAIAGGPMQRAVMGLSGASDADIADIAATIVATMGPVTEERVRRETGARQRGAVPLAGTQVEPAFATGAAVYATACASCHDRGRDLSSNGALPMPLAVALYDDDPHSFVRIVRDGIQPAIGDTGRFMPAFGTSLSDDQLAALAAYLRHDAAAAPAWSTLDAVVKEQQR